MKTAGEKKGGGVLQLMKCTDKAKNALIHEAYLKGVLTELIQGESIKFHTSIYDKDFLQEKLLNEISKMCFDLAYVFWKKIKKYLQVAKNKIPFVVFNQDSLEFELTNSEEVLYMYGEGEVYRKQVLVVSPMFYQEMYDSQGVIRDEYIQYRSAKKMEDFLLDRINFNYN